jgi:hypothetical protein
MPAAATASTGSTVASQTVIYSDPPLECSDISGQISASEASSGDQEVLLKTRPPVEDKATVGQSIIGQIPTAAAGKDCHVTVVENIAVIANGGSTSSSRSLPAKLLDNCPSTNSQNTASVSNCHLSPAVSESKPPAKSTNVIDAHDCQIAKITISQNSVSTAAKIVNFNSPGTLLAKCKATTSQKFDVSAAANSDTTVASDDKMDFGPPEEHQASFNQHRDTLAASNGSNVANHVRMDSERLAKLQESQLKREKTVR